MTLIQEARKQTLKMARHPDFQKISNRFIQTFDEVEGNRRYSAFITSKGLDETKSFPKKNECKEHMCTVIGVEIKENEKEFHVEGLIATDHIDSLDEVEGVDIPDLIPKESLESFANQINTTMSAGVMGVHHSEGNPINPQFYGRADVSNTPAKVIKLSDGHNGVYVDTKLLKNDPETPGIIKQFQDGDLNSFSITYDTNGFMTTDFDWVGDKLVRIINPDTKLYGYTAASNPVNRNAVATGYGFKEFKELVEIKENTTKEVVKMSEDKKDEAVAETKVEGQDSENNTVEEKVEDKPLKEPESKPEGSEEDSNEQKEFQKWKSEKKEHEQKEMLDKTATKIAEGVLKQMEVKEKVLKDDKAPADTKEIPMEIKEFNKMVTEDCTVEIKEQFRRAAAASDKLGMDWETAKTAPVEKREFKNFAVNGTKLEYKGLGVTTNQNSDTDYLQSTAELQDMYDPIIYNALNQETVTWNILAKDDYSKQGNNQVQFTLKIAANSSATFYTGNSVSTDNVDRLKYQTKFKKIQVGVSVDGDMIAAARGGPVNNVFAQEVLDSAMDMLEVVNAALYAEVGLETASAVIGFEYIADSAGNTSLYNMTRSATNKLAPDAAGDTYIDGSSAVISMFNLRKMKRQATTEGAKKRNLCYFTSPLQGDILRGKFDDQRRLYTDKDSKFGFSSDLWIDGIPVFEDIDCNTDDWFCVDLESHRIGMWVPPTIEKLGKAADSEDAFVKMYFAVYNRRPRALSMCHTNATS